MTNLVGHFLHVFPKGKGAALAHVTCVRYLLRVRMLARGTVDTVGNPLVIRWTVMVGVRHT